MNERVARYVPIALVLALLLYYAALAVAADRTRDANRRQFTLLSLGSATSAREGSVSAAGDDLRISADRGNGAATWNDYSYEITHLTNRARSCAISVAVVGLALTSPTTRGSAEIVVNGNVVRRIAFSQNLAGLYPFAKERFVPEDMRPARIELVPLDPEYGLVVPISSAYCKANSLAVGVRVSRATWNISHAGVLLTYTPARPSGPAAWKTILFGGICSIALLANLYTALRKLSSLGAVPLAIGTLLLALSPLTYDQWDFRLWLNFSEVALFGSGDPAYLWKGSPLWAFVPALFSSLTSACYALTGHGSLALTALALKAGMAIAYCFSACAIAMRAPSAARRRYAIVALLMPLGLFTLGAGYRELFASAIAIASLEAASRRKLLLSTALAALAAAISETFVPMIVLPAIVASIAPRPLGARLGAAAALATLGSLLFALQWFLLLPPALTTNAFAFRFGAAHFGGASWAGALQRFALLPAWLPAGAPLFDALLFGALAILPVVRCARVLTSRRRMARGAEFDEIVAATIALVAAFLLAFRGTDPNMWYAVTSVLLWYFAGARPSNPFPLLLGSIEGLAFYATVGFREFVNQAFFWPVDRGLLGILSTSRYVFVLTIDALLLAFIVSWPFTSVQLFSRRSRQFLMLFFSAVAATAIANVTLDGIICIAVATCIITTFSLEFLEQQGRNADAGAPRASRFAACDVVLAAGALALLTTQPGAGTVSRIGWIILISCFVAIGARIVVRTRGALSHDR